jgi:hypothetical protein
VSRYFFDFHDGVTLIDDVGIELCNLDAARSEALRSLSAIAADFVASVPVEEFSMIVRDETGTTVLTAQLTFKVVETVASGD